MHFLDYINGFVRIRITGNSYDRFLNLCAFHRIRLWNLVPCKESYEAYVTGKDFKKLKTIVKKSRTAVKIVRRYGLPFFVHKYRKRKMYLVGIVSGLLFMVWLSSHIWNITVDGNVSQTDDVIFEYLYQEGISHGIWKSQVDCQELSAKIRDYFTQFSWVATELKGTRLIIHVKEGILMDEEEISGEKKEASSLTAAQDGTIVSMYVRKGRAVAMCGDTVKKGDLLVSGILPVYNDGGEIVSHQYVYADADIIIQKEQKYYDRLSMKSQVKRYTGRKKTRMLLRIGDHPFALPDHFDQFEQYDLFSETTQYKLMENFYLPVFLQKFTAKEYEKEEIIYTKEQAAAILTRNLQYFLENLEEKGVQIFENNVKIEWNEKSAIASGTLTTGAYAVNRVAAENTEEELQENEYG